MTQSENIATSKSLGGCEKMLISNFENIRVGSEYPYCFNIMVVSEHETCGVFAVANTIDENKPQVLELRKNKYGQIALFNYFSIDQELPGSWKDSEILWKNY